MTEAKIEFGTFEPEAKVNPYTEVVAQLAEAGENASVTLTVDHDKVIKERNLFAKAANGIDKTARLRDKDESKVKYGTDDEGEQVSVGGTVRLTFTLSPRHKARRGKAAEGAAEAGE